MNRQQKRNQSRMNNNPKIVEQNRLDAITKKTKEHLTNKITNLLELEKSLVADTTTNWSGMHIRLQPPDDFLGYRAIITCFIIGYRDKKGKSCLLLQASDSDSGIHEHICRSQANKYIFNSKNECLRGDNLLSNKDYLCILIENEPVYAMVGWDDTKLTVKKQSNEINENLEKNIEDDECPNLV